MKRQHTPGPWKVTMPQHGHPTKYRCVQIGKDEQYSTLEVLPADAVLIAAAPDLLALLKDLIDIEGPGPGNIDWYNRVVDAIAKAEGGAR